jgi:tetratricopeptide (TPR) repeat protein
VHLRSLWAGGRALLAGAIVAGLTVPGGDAQGQLARRTSSERILVLNPIPVAGDCAVTEQCQKVIREGADSAYAVALAEELRTRLTAKYRFRMNIVSTEDYCTVLEASGYNCKAPLAPADAPPLARVVSASGYVVSWVHPAPGGVTFAIRMVDAARSGLSGWERISAPGGTPAGELARLATDQFENRIKAAEFARECEARRERNDFKGAAGQAARAFEIFPNHPSAAGCMALAHEVARSPVDSIIAALRRAVAGDSLHKRSWEDLSRRLIEKGDTAGAVDAALNQLRSDPTDGALRARVAGALIAGGRYQESVQILDEGLSQNPGDLPLQALKERACVEGSLWPCALEAMEGRFAVDTALASDSLFYTGAFAAAQSAEDTAAMLKWSQRAVEKFPESVSLWRARAAALKAANDRAGALQAYDRILAYDSTQIASALAAAQYLLDSTLVIDTTVPLDTARLLKGERLLDMVAAGSQADTAVRLNVAGMFYNPAAKIAQNQMRPHLPLAARFLEKALRNDLRGNLQRPANFFLGLAYALQVFEGLDQLQNSKSCETVAAKLDQANKAHAALTIGRSISPPTADRLLPYLTRLRTDLPKYQEAWKCR